MFRNLAMSTMQRAETVAYLLRTTGYNARVDSFNVLTPTPSFSVWTDAPQNVTDDFADFMVTRHPLDNRAVNS